MDMFQTFFCLHLVVSAYCMDNSSLLTTENIHQETESVSSIKKSLYSSPSPTHTASYGVVSSIMMNIQSSSLVSDTRHSDVVTRTVNPTSFQNISPTSMLGTYISQSETVQQQSVSRPVESKSGSLLPSGSMDTLNVSPSLTLQRSGVVSPDMETILSTSVSELSTTAATLDLEQTASVGAMSSQTNIMPTRSRTVVSSPASLISQTNVSTGVVLRLNATVLPDLQGSESELTAITINKTFPVLDTASSSKYSGNITESINVTKSVLHPVSNYSRIDIGPSSIFPSFSGFISSNQSSVLKSEYKDTESRSPFIGHVNDTSSTFEVTKTPVITMSHSSLDYILSSMIDSQSKSNFTHSDGMSTKVEILSEISASLLKVSSSKEVSVQHSSVSVDSFTAVTIATVMPSKSEGMVLETIVPLIPKIEYNETVNIVNNLTCEIRFQGNCDLIVKNKVLLGEFWEAFVVIISDVLLVKRSSIRARDIACNPLRLSFTIVDVPSSDLETKLEEYVITGQLSVPVLFDNSLEMYTAISINLDPKFKSEDDDDLFVIGLRQVDIIVIVSACLVSLVLICIGFFICVREYYNRKRTRSFDLSDVVHWNMNMEDYTLTKIPRARSSYDDKGVQMNSFRRKKGSRPNSHELQAQVENVPAKSAATNGSILTDVHLKMDSGANGLIVGVTGITDPLLPANQTSPTHSDKSCDKQYGSNDNLYEQSNSPLRSVDNPIYYADDDRFSSV